MTQLLAMTSRDRRALALSATTLVLLVGLSRGLPALRTWESGRTSEAQSAGEQLAEIRGNMRLLPALRETLLVRRARLATLDSLLPAEASPAGVAASIASTLDKLADDNGAKLSTLQLRADTVVTAGRVRVSVRLAGVADVTGVAGFLRSIEAGDVPLVVRDLSISQPEPAAPDSKPEALHFDVLVAGIGRIALHPREARE